VETHSQGGFPQTRHSLILAAQGDDAGARSRALDAITAVYWKPIYKYVRLKWDLTSEDAADFTQEFFTRLLEKEFLDSYESSKGRLRTFLRTCADRLFLKQVRDSARLKRGAGSPHSALDFEAAEHELSMASTHPTPDDAFDREWARSLFALGVQRLRNHLDGEGKSMHFRLFERYDLNDDDDKMSYAQLATEFELTSTDVTNYLALARREFRRCVLDQLREMTASDDEFRREAQSLLGLEIK
jgi:DNA-directed RNA polymerase specialized sigma24 family protein